MEWTYDLKCLDFPVKSPHSTPLQMIIKSKFIVYKLRSELVLKSKELMMFSSQNHYSHPVGWWPQAVFIRIRSSSRLSVVTSNIFIFWVAWKSIRLPLSFTSFRWWDSRWYLWYGTCMCGDSFPAYIFTCNLFHANETVRSFEFIRFNLLHVYMFYFSRVNHQTCEQDCVLHFMVNCNWSL